LNTKFSMCEQCGALVGDKKLHAGSHTTVIAGVGFKDVIVDVRIPEKKRKEKITDLS